MPETQTFSYTFKEIAEVLVRERGIHDGFWAVSLEFAIAGGMIPFSSGDGVNLTPAAIVPVVKIGIHRFDTPNALTVNAADVNPSSNEKDLVKPQEATSPPKKKGLKKPQRGA